MTSRGTRAQPTPERVAKTPKAGKKQASRSQPVPVLPSVNILSSWVFERMAVSRLRRRFALAGFVIVLILVAGWSFQQLRIDEADKALAVEQAETARLTVQTKELTPVRTYVATVGQQVLTVQNNMASEIFFSRVLEELQRDTPLGAKVESLDIALDPQAASVALGEAPTAADGATAIPIESPCPGPDPFNTKVVVGCITLSGTAASRADVGELVINLGADGLFVEPFISATTTADGGVTFSGSVGLSEKVYSQRYADLAKLMKAGGAE